MLTGAEYPSSYVASVFALLDKRRDWSFKAPTLGNDADLEAYSGRYSNQPWSAEIAVVPWAGGLAVLSLPSSDPASDLLVLKAKGGNVFRAVRTDGSEADEVHFDRDLTGRVTQFVRFSNPKRRIGSVSGG
jgi:hypothetical protein